MEDTAKYLIHADFVADGIIERSDVVGAVFGQTEGLLGEELDIRDLQQSSKLGRIDVEVESQDGQSQGHLTIASSLDRVETAILGAALEAIDRIGPCRARLEVARIEDVRAAKRREVVDRAKELLATAFDETVMDSDEILEEVRESVRVEDITEYEGLPAGPRVADSDAIIVVEGRADVLNLLKYGIKNAIGVEGTNVPDAIADLTRDRTVTAFLDSDRGGDLIRRELRQVGDVDYIARAPGGESVEDLTRGEVDAALRNKVPVESFDEDQATAVTDGSTAAAATGERGTDDAATPAGPEAGATGERTATNGTCVEGDASTSPEAAVAVDPVGGPEGPEAPTGTDDTREADTADGEAADTDSAEADTADADAGGDTADADAGGDTAGPAAGGAAAETHSLADHVAAVVGDGGARLLDDDLSVLADVDASAAFDAIRDAETAPATVVVDGEITQRLVDVAAQRGVSRLVGAEEGEFVKQPASVQVFVAEDF